MRAEDDRPQKGLERLARLEPGRLVAQPAPDVDEPGGNESSSRLLRSGVMGETEPAVAHPGQHALDRGDVALPAALGHQPTARSEHRRQVREQGVMVGDPVERGRGKDRVNRLGER